ncbi:KxYKxGKxW signal peptide domain-containing protein, partial [Oenococcus oeni]
MRDGDKIVRKKLYKSGKRFVIAGIFSIIGIGIATVPASAADIVDNATTVNTVQAEPEKQEDSKVDTTSQATTNSNQKN